MFEIRRYTKESAVEWNLFVAASKNGTFLLDRRYMDYHSDRFCDYSLMFYRNEKLYAILPANICGDTFQSHGGLTYGGLIMNAKTTAAAIVVLFQEMNAYLKEHGIKRVLYKCVPWIYHIEPAEEDLYAIFRTCNAHIITRNISTVIIQDKRIKWEYIRRRGVKRAIKNDIKIERSDDFSSFWDVLDENLMDKYCARPVHSLDEITLLKSNFPDNIVLYVGKKDNMTLGGVVLYVTQQVVHTQYISANQEGKHCGVLDSVFDQIINKDYKEYKYFDFGKSTEDNGHVLNESLIYQKEGFGGRGVCYDWYEWTL